MNLPRRLVVMAAAILPLGLGGCGESAPDKTNSDGFDPTSVEVPPEFAPRDAPDTVPSGLSSEENAVPALTLASGPDVCFREIANKFGPDIKVAEITSFFSAGKAISGRSEPRGQMTTCTVSFQNPVDPRKLLTATYNTRTGAFGEPSPVEITVMGNAANFRLADYVVPLDRVDAAALAGVMRAQEKRLKSVYGDFAWSGVRLEGPDAFSRTHTLRLDLDGRLAANDIKDGGYASVSLDGKRITANHLMP